jgi:hypothetical protein
MVTKKSRGMSRFYVLELGSHCHKIFFLRFYRAFDDPLIKIMLTQNYQRPPGGKWLMKKPKVKNRVTQLL